MTNFKTLALCVFTVSSFPITNALADGLMTKDNVIGGVVTGAGAAAWISGSNAKSKLFELELKNAALEGENAGYFDAKLSILKERDDWVKKKMKPHLAEYEGLQKEMERSVRYKNAQIMIEQYEANLENLRIRERKAILPGTRYEIENLIHGFEMALKEERAVPAPAADFAAKEARLAQLQKIKAGFQKEWLSKNKDYAKQMAKLNTAEKVNNLQLNKNYSLHGEKELKWLRNRMLGAIGLIGGAGYLYFNGSAYAEPHEPSVIQSMNVRPKSAPANSSGLVDAGDSELNPGAEVNTAK